MVKLKKGSHVVECVENAVNVWERMGYKKYTPKVEPKKKK